MRIGRCVARNGSPGDGREGDLYDPTSRACLDGGSRHGHRGGSLGSRHQNHERPGYFSTVTTSSLAVKGTSESWTFVIDKDTEVTAKGATTKSLALKADGKSSVLTDFVKVGDRVSVSYREMGTMKHAATISVTAQAAAEVTPAHALTASHTCVLDCAWRLAVSFSREARERHHLSASSSDHQSIPWHSNRALSRTSTSAKRLDGSLAKQRRTTACKSAGTSGRRLVTAAGSSYI